MSISEIGEYTEKPVKVELKEHFQNRKSVRVSYLFGLHNKAEIIQNPDGCAPSCKTGLMNYRRQRSSVTTKKKSTNSYNKVNVFRLFFGTGEKR